MPDARATSRLAPRRAGPTHSVRAVRCINFLHIMYTNMRGAGRPPCERARGPS